MSVISTNRLCPNRILITDLLITDYSGPLEDGNQMEPYSETENPMLAPLPPDYWSAEAAGHLALRAGFGQMPDESKKWSEQGMGAMLNHPLQTPADNNWLDLGSSQKEHPNENFARELMELFTPGEGHYTEDDVKAAARSFTGYRVAGPAEEFRFVPAQFDPSDKTFLGKTGPWRGDQVIDIILSQPQCAKFIAAKIWRFFAYEDPAPPLVDALADQLLRCNYEPKPFMKIMLSSQEFFSSQARKSIIKSPVQFLVQGQRTLGLPLPPRQSLVFIYRQLPSPLKEAGTSSNTFACAYPSHSINHRLPRRQVRFRRRSKGSAPSSGEAEPRNFPSYARRGPAR